MLKLLPLEYLYYLILILNKCMPVKIPLTAELIMLFSLFKGKSYYFKSYFKKLWLNAVWIDDNNKVLHMKEIYLYFLSSRSKYARNFIHMIKDVCKHFTLLILIAHFDSCMLGVVQMKIKLNCLFRFIKGKQIRSKSERPFLNLIRHATTI